MKIAIINQTSMSGIMDSFPDEVILPALGYPGIREALFGEPLPDAEIREALQRRQP